MRRYFKATRATVVQWEKQSNRQRRARRSLQLGGECGDRSNPSLPPSGARSNPKPPPCGDRQQQGRRDESRRLTSAGSATVEERSGDRSNPSPPRGDRRNPSPPPCGARRHPRPPPCENTGVRVGEISRIPSGALFVARERTDRRSFESVKGATFGRPWKSGAERKCLHPVPCEELWRGEASYLQGPKSFARHRIGFGAVSYRSPVPSEEAAGPLGVP